MISAFLATLLFSASVVCANRAARCIGSIEANFWRLLIATIILAVWAHGSGKGLSGDGFLIFLLSGFIGFGLGDLALFQALPRLGSRLTMLLVHCLAAPFAAIIEWLWLGTALSTGEILGGMTILAGVSLALAPGSHPHQATRDYIPGIFFGVLSALGQGSGAVLSRKAYELTAQAGQSIDGITAAYQRILGGLVVAVVFFLFSKRRVIPETESDQVDKTGSSSGQTWRLAGPWIFLNAVAGPVLGVSCFQWALQMTPTGIVLPIVATAPLVVIPFSRAMEQDQPGFRALAGSILAVVGVVTLVMLRQ